MVLKLVQEIDKSKLEMRIHGLCKPETFQVTTKKLTILNSKTYGIDPRIEP